MEKHVKANLIWSFGVLLLLIVFLAAFRIPNPSRLADLVSFAATIASLILAAFAIVQGLMSSADAQASKVDAARFNEKTTAMLDLLNRQMPEIKSEIRRVSDRVHDFRQLEDGSPSQEEKGETQVASEDKVDVGVNLKDSAKQIVEGASLAGLLAIEAAGLSLEKKKPIMLNVLKDGDLRWYTIGYLVALGSMNWVSASFVNDDSGAPILSISGIREELLEQMPIIATKLDERIPNYDPSTMVPAGRIALRGYFAEG